MTIRTLLERFTSRNPLAAYTKIFLASLLYVFGIQSFLNVGGTFSAGLGALGQLLTYLISDLKNYFALLYIALNIPFIIFFAKKVKKSFIYRTTFFLISQALVGAIYLLPEVNHVLTNFMNLGDGTDLVVARTKAKWAILLYAFIGAALVGIASAISWKNGGSTAGTDFVGYYYSTKKQQSIGAVLFKISTAVATLSIIMTLIFNPEMMRARENWLLLIVATFLYIGVVVLMMNVFYPKYSKVKLEIHSSKCSQIIADLKRTKFHHAYNILEMKSGYTNQRRQTITSVVLYLEVKNIIRHLYEIDPDIWISEIRVKRVFGAFSTKSVED